MRNKFRLQTRLDEARGETRIMYASDLEATNAKTSRASKLLASSQKPSHFSFSLLLPFVTIRVGVGDVKVNLRNGAFKVRGLMRSLSQKQSRESPSTPWWPSRRIDRNVGVIKAQR